MDDQNNNNNSNDFNSFDNNNNLFDLDNNIQSSYDPFSDNMYYNQTNNVDNNMQYNQDNNFSGNMQYSQDNNFNGNMQYSQDNNFYANMQNGQINNNLNAYEQPIDNNSQYIPNNDYNANVQFNQPNGYDANSQFNQPNGYDTNSQFNQPNAYDANNQFNNQDSYADNSDYSTNFTKTWMRNIYDKAQSKKFNWCSAFFGGTYFMYRKMYLTGILFLILSNLALSIPLLMFFNGKIELPICTILTFLLPIIFMIVYGFAFYPLYKNFVNKKLNKLKTTITDNSALINIATQKGGTSVLGVVLALILSSVISTTVLGATVANSIEKLISKLPDESQNGGVTNEITEPTTDIKSFNFLNEYSIDYDSLSWFLNPIDNTLTKGNYNLKFSGQYVDDIKNTLNVDVSNNAGRANLLNTLISSLEAQAATINLTVEVGTSTFVASDNCFYAYIDVISDSDIARYYILLLPENDILFQFVLTVDDTTIDYATNLEVINILTSISSEETDLDADENANTISNSTIDNTTSNELGTDNTISNEVGGDNANNVDVNSVSNVSSGTTNSTIDITTNSTANNQVPLESLLSR